MLRYPKKFSRLKPKNLVYFPQNVDFVLTNLEINYSDNIIFLNLNY